MEEKKYYCPVCGHELEIDEDDYTSYTSTDDETKKEIFVEEYGLYCENCDDERGYRHAYPGLLTKTSWIIPKDETVKFFNKGVDEQSALCYNNNVKRGPRDETY